MNICISNLDATLNQEDLKNLFQNFGTVETVDIAMDLFTEKPRGFAYVEMPNEAQATAAIKALNQSDFQSRTITVTEAPAKDVRKGSYKVGNGAVNVYKFNKK